MDGPEDVASVALWLESDASKYETGQSLIMDEELKTSTTIGQ
jgi:hypothetical protein